MHAPADVPPAAPSADTDREHGRLGGTLSAMTLVIIGSGTVRGKKIGLIQIQYFLTLLEVPL